MAEGDSSGRRAADAVRSATNELLGHVRALSDLLRPPAGGVAAAAAPVTRAASDLVDSLRAVVAGVPAPSVPVDLLLEELRAKRALVNAMQVQLTSFDAQLAVLERSLVPLQEWSRHWDRVEAALLDPLLRRDDT